jgi:squalene-hopene/tetraprenyl-beta-curcumene cyclase
MSTPDSISEPNAARSLLVPAPPRARLDAAIAAARDWLLARQTPEGFWQGELEGDTTLESYLILIEAFFNRRESEKVRELARVIRAEALPEGGWPQYFGGPPELSVSCLSYFALKVAGDPAEAPHLRAARAAIRRLGGVGRANTYTRQHLAMFGQVPWDSVPAVPPEMVFAPKSAPFSVYDLSAWSRTIFVPLSIIWAKKPVIALPPSCGVAELLEDDLLGDPQRVPEPPREGLRWAKPSSVHASIMGTLGGSPSPPREGEQRPVRTGSRDRGAASRRGCGCRSWKRSVP